MAKNHRREHLKTAQLCAQVAEALSLALGAIEDDVILGLDVLEVVPAPDGTRLAVRLAVSGEHEADMVHERLERFAGRLRSEVAGAIHRKKAPALFYLLVPSPAQNEGA
jgi:ribosome-binding factor A